ncbi:hypothetical protein CERSUDRAFT_58912, partial [Gelatoporia subvermispora B]
MSSATGTKSVLKVLHKEGLTLRTFLASVLRDKVFKNDADVVDLRQNGHELVEWLVNDAGANTLAKSWAVAATKQMCGAELKALAKKSAGMHFNATNATEGQLEEFDVKVLAETMIAQAPTTWDLLGAFLEADQSLVRRRERRLARLNVTQLHKSPIRPLSPPITDPSGIVEGDVDGDDGDGDGEAQEAGANSASDGGEPHPDQLRKQRAGLLAMVRVLKSVVCMSIMLNNTNQKCNMLQTMIGLFLHACNTPEAIVDLLSRCGLSISRSTINGAVKNLSAEAGTEIQKLGKSLL